MSNNIATIPFIDLAAQQQRIQGKLNQVWTTLLQHGRYVNGPEIKQAETALAQFCGVGNLALLSSGTDALVLALHSLEIGAGDAVIVPDFTFIASVQSIRAVGATPILADISMANFNLATEQLAAALALAQQQRLQVKAIMPVDLYGCPADYASINQFAARNNLAVIADAAQSFGASENGQTVGTLADITTFSFYPVKPLGAYGDAGGVASDNPKLIERIKLLREHGADINNKYKHIYQGTNARIDSLQAGILLAKLSIFPDEMVQRQQVALRYQQLLAEVPGIQWQQVAANQQSAWAQFTITVPAESREQIVVGLRKLGIPTAIHYPLPIHLQPAYQHCLKVGQCPNSLEASKSVMSLPMHPYLTAASQRRIVNALAEVINQLNANTLDKPA